MPNDIGFVDARRDEYTLGFIESFELKKSPKVIINTRQGINNLMQTLSLVALQSLHE